MKTIGGQDFDPSQWARLVEYEIVPQLHKQSGLLRGKETVAQPTPPADAALLVEATASFAPPADLYGGAELYGTLMMLVALRAHASDTAYLMDMRERYKRAAQWVCENLGEFIFWDCK
jgi:hypothetical protein